MQSALGLLIGPPVIGGFTYILQHTGPYVPLYLWAFFFVLQIFFLTVELHPTVAPWSGVGAACMGTAGSGCMCLSVGCVPAGLPPLHCPVVQQVLALGRWPLAVSPQLHLHSRLHGASVQRCHGTVQCH